MKSKNRKICNTQSNSGPGAAYFAWRRILSGLSKVFSIFLLLAFVLTVNVYAGSDAPQAVQMDRPDGRYSIEVSLSGGSGRAFVTSPTWLTVRGGQGYATILWSSPYYDYMILDGKRYLNETRDGGNSTFTIPITALDVPMEIIADTTAMGDPVEIAYTLTFYEDSVGSKNRVPQEGAKSVLTGAFLFIVIGGIADHLIKKRRRQ